MEVSVGNNVSGRTTHIKRYFVTFGKMFAGYRERGSIENVERAVEKF